MNTEPEPKPLNAWLRRWSTEALEIFLTDRYGLPEVHAAIRAELERRRTQNPKNEQ